MSEFHSAGHITDEPQGFSFANVHRNNMIEGYAEDRKKQTHFPQVSQNGRISI